jgi:hypothetical protein
VRDIDAEAPLRTQDHCENCFIHLRASIVGIDLNEVNSALFPSLQLAQEKIAMFFEVIKSIRRVPLEDAVCGTMSLTTRVSKIRKTERNKITQRSLSFVTAGLFSAASGV